MDKELRDKILKTYQTSRNSIQDIARINRVDVHEVLEIIGEGNLSTVTMLGDMVDPSELRGTNAEFNNGSTARVEISTN